MTLRIKCVHSALCSMALLLAVPALGQPLVVDDARVRAMPPGAANSAGYLTVTNSSESPLTIIGASSPAASRVELHTTLQQDGMMRMRAVESLPLAPGESAELAPGGMHLMLMQLTTPLVPGNTMQLCLELAELDESLCFDAIVAEMATQGSVHRH